jgi:FKBP-type peptidyl-prolyl cis-trans isomerase
MKTLLALLILLSAPALASAEEAPAKDQADKTGYSVGYALGEDFRSTATPIDPEALARGARDALEGKESTLSKQERTSVLEQVQAKMQAAKRAQAEAESRQNLEEGKKWLAENAKKPGVSQTASGLQYKITEEGTGKKPGPDDSVTVQYRGRLIDGTEFDSSYKRGQPATFRLKGVIKGWTEGLQLMREGGKAEFYIPPELAYGSRRAGAQIPPNSTLVFEIELQKVNAPETRPPVSSPAK